jgi:hypothetical protein
MKKGLLEMKALFLFMEMMLMYFLIYRIAIEYDK